MKPKTLPKPKVIEPDPPEPKLHVWKDLQTDELFVDDMNFSNWDDD